MPNQTLPRKNSTSKKYKSVPRGRCCQRKKTNKPKIPTLVREIPNSRSKSERSEYLSSYVRVHPTCPRKAERKGCGRGEDSPAHHAQHFRILLPNQQPLRTAGTERGYCSQRRTIPLSTYALRTTSLQNPPLCSHLQRTTDCPNHSARYAQIL